MPPDLETILLKSLQREAGDRYATAQEFADDLRRFLQATNDLTDAPDNELGFAFIYDRDGNGVIDQHEAHLRALANEVFAGINEAGEA